MTSTEIRLKAAELIEYSGWIQGKNQSNEGYCLIGALGSAAPTSQIWVAASQSLKRDLKTRDLAEWNDDPDRTKEEVITALRGKAS